MATDLIYMHTSESNKYEMDFSPDLPDDAALNDVGSGSTISAFSSDGTDVGATILASKTRTAMVLSVVISSLTEFEEYRIEFLGQGSTTSEKVMRVLEIRARKEIQGGF